VAVTNQPVNRIVLHAGSVADDVGFMALNDLSHVMSGVGYRVIGGHMVMALVARWGLGSDLYRQTQDTDIGIPPVIAHDPAIVDRFLTYGYERRAGNRFARPIVDIPIRLNGSHVASPAAIVDILVPSYTSHPRQNRKFGQHLATTEVPGLAAALQRSAIDVAYQRSS
jgi:hypothetical protein